jgi:hypothetical protein
MPANKKSVLIRNLAEILSVPDYQKVEFAISGFTKELNSKFTNEFNLINSSCSCLMASLLGLTGFFGTLLWTIPANRWSLSGSASWIGTSLIGMIIFTISGKLLGIVVKKIKKKWLIEKLTHLEQNNCKLA